MAGVTTYPYRHLCNTHGATLTVSEMLHSSMLTTPTTLHKAIFSAGTKSDPIPSAQLYGTDPTTLATATTTLRKRHVRHIDLNFGCPAPKALRAGAGAAIPANLPLLKDIIKAVVHAAQHVPVTAKMRIGVFGQSTYLNAAQVLQKYGVAAIVLHSRTAEQMYLNNTAKMAWKHIKILKDNVDIPVIGNGDVFTAQDAVDMLIQTGADGVAIGRGCLGRPWLFKDVKDALTGKKIQLTIPLWKDVAMTMLWHLDALVCTQSSVLLQDGKQELGRVEMNVVRQFRKWLMWYAQGYLLPQNWVKDLQKVDCIHTLRNRIEDSFDWQVLVDLDQVVAPRGKT